MRPGRHDADGDEVLPCFGAFQPALGDCYPRDVVEVHDSLTRLEPQDCAAVDRAAGEAAGFPSTSPVNSAIGIILPIELSYK